MPKIVLDHVVSCSSEDPDHVASNLLNSGTNKKWKCKTVGETSASVIFQLEKSSNISGIDIGNENSSFIEVLVGRSSSKEQEYKIILAMSSFMTPMEARNLTNNNRVRMFTYDNLASTTRDEKWDRVKVVCTQPFNKYVQYGLSFLTLHSPQEKKQDEPLTFGKFTLRPESPNTLTSGSLFAKRKELEPQPDNNITVAQAIKSTDTPKHKPTKKQTSSGSKASSSKDSEDKNRNRKALFYDSDEETANEKIDKVIEKVKEETEKEAKIKPSKKKDERSPKPSKPTKKDDKNNSLKRKVNVTLDEQNKKQKLCKKPFSELLKEVVFTISGIVNPERANLRTLALSMGAKYKPDWDDSCTHLICAFANTPKFNHVRGKGKIVTKMWIKDCFDQRKRLPWRRYALDRNDQGKSESEDEVEEKIDDSEEDDKKNVEDNLSGSDTDDEIEKILTKKKELQSDQNGDTFNADTEEEELKKNPTDLEDIPKLFNSEIFFIDDIFNEEEKNKLGRLIKAFDGVVLTSLRNIVDFVITKENSVKLIKERPSNAKCVSYKWIYECHNALKRTSYDNFVLT